VFNLACDVLFITSVEHLSRQQLLAEMAKRDEDNARLQRENERLEQLLRLMEQKVDGLVRRLFGTSSEKLDPAQLQLLLLELSGAAGGEWLPAIRPSERLRPAHHLGRDDPRACAHVARCRSERSTHSRNPIHPAHHDQPVKRSIDWPDFP
jgi:hypothetical protein